MKVELLHPPEIDGDAFADGGISTFLAGEGALICSRDRSDLEMLFLWSSKQTQNQPR
jgi:hypothetical protein